MGQAKNRGSREERVAQAKEAGRTPGAPAREKPYAFKMPLSTPALDRLWPLFKVFGEQTIGDIRAQAIAAQKAAQARRQDMGEMTPDERRAAIEQMVRPQASPSDIVVDEVSSFPGTDNV